MRDANRLRRLVWNGPAPAPVASKPRTRAASGLRPAANTGCLPGAWLSGAERSPDFRRKRRRARRIRPPPQSAARRRRRTPQRRAGRRHVFARKRAHTDQLRRLARRPLSSRRREKRNKPRAQDAPRERRRLHAMMNESETEAEMIEREIASLSPEDKERARIGIVRWRADLLHFPHLCPKGSCRRTRKCSGNPDICMNLLAPFVPEAVHEPSRSSSTPTTASPTTRFEPRRRSKCRRTKSGWERSVTRKRPRLRFCGASHVARARNLMSSDGDLRQSLTPGRR